MNKIKRSVKTLGVLSILFCLVGMSNAQDYYGGGWRKRQAENPPPKEKEDAASTPPSGFLSVNFGFANPEGSFAQPYSQGGYSEAVGAGYGNYAQPGSVFHFSFGIPIQHSNFGLAFMFGSDNNGYNQDSYINSLVNSNVNYNPYSNSPITGYASAPAQNQYSESSIMGGLFFTYPIGRLSIDCRLMIGALLCSLPEQNVVAQDADGDQLEFDVEPSYPTSLAFDGGVGARFLVAQFGRRKLCVMVNVDYLYSNVTYSTQQDLTVVPAAGPNAGSVVSLIPTPAVAGKLPIELLNVSFGLGYQLN